jgi:hypothetical protein
MKSKLLVKTETPYRYMIEKELGENPTANDVLEHLFGDADCWINSDYTVKQYVKSKNNPIHRINLLWVLPCYFVFIAPIRWIITGSPGVKNESRAAKVLRFFIGELS